MKELPFLRPRFLHAAAILTVMGVLVGGVAALAVKPAATPARTHFRRGGEPPVTLVRVPDGGIQPQAAVDASGTLHLVYFRGDPAHGDLFYVRKKLGVPSPFSAPVRVNSRPRSAIALGTIRGAQIALGKGGHVFVAWNGSDEAASEGRNGLTPMLFARSNGDGTAFEAERNLIAGNELINGGGAVAADPKSGAVYVLWHGAPKESGEANAGVYLTRSTDDGATFAAPNRVVAPAVGACGCCGMRAVVDHAGALYVLFRSAVKNWDRDTMLLTSHDRGANFTQSDLQPYRAGTCPMSLFGLAPAPGESAGVWGAWETQGRVYLATLNAQSAAQPPATLAVRRGEGDQKYPVVAVAPDGQRIVAWAEGAGWRRGGALAWQTYAADGTPSGEPGRIAGAEGVPMWSLPAAVARPDGTFVILY